MAQVFNNSMVAHVWAQGEQPHGRSHNGNFYFDGRILYSYGSHFAVGVRMNDAQAVLNSDSYSISTSGMQSDAANAVCHFATVYIPKLQDIARDLSYIANNGAAKSPRHVAAVIAHIEQHADVMAFKAGSYRWQSEAAAEGDETRADRLLRFCGIPKARAAAAIKRGLAKAAKRAKAEAAEKRKRDKAEAVAFADMTPNEFDGALERRFHVRPFNGNRSNDIYQAEALGRVSKALFRMIKTAKAEKLSAARLGRLKAHRAGVLATLKAYNDDAAEYVARQHAERFANWEARYTAAKDDAERLAVWRTNGVSPAAYAEGSPERAKLEAADAEGRALDSADRMAKEREAREAWLKGEGPARVYLSGPNGTALVRRSPDGERLETSQGADVPWDHAVKAFRFIRLCVERGEGFKSNGRVIRVGHFRVDEITPEGDMRAGCHRFAWQAMRELAEREGVFELSPSAEAVETREGVAH
jgi:hypothetical protein